MSKIPHGWKCVSLHEVATIQTGIAKGKEYTSGTIRVPYLRVANVQDGHLDLSEIKVIEVAPHEVDRYRLQYGDVLLTEGGDFDKLGRGDVWRGQIPLCLHQNHIFVVRPNSEVLDPFFLSYQTGSPYGKAYFLACSKQSTNLATINSSQLKEYPALLPPLPEQRKIAAILSTWDEAITLTERLIAALKARKQALMQLLLTGKVRFPGFEWAWEEVSFEDVSTINPPKPRNIPEETQVSFITMSDISEDARVLSMRDRKFNEVKQGFTPFQEKDVLIAKITPCFENGKGAFVEGLTNGIGFGSTEFHVIRVDQSQLLPQFAYYYTHTHHFRGNGEASMSGSAGQKRVPSEFVQSFRIGLPALVEQERIIEVLMECDCAIAVLSNLREQHSMQKRGLMQQLLTGAIRVQGEA